MVRNLVTRLLAAAMLIASPAIGGQVLPLLHPCPVAEGETGHDHSGHGDHNAPSTDSNQCICIGSCAASAAVTAPHGTTVASRQEPLRDPVAPPVGNRDLAPAGHPPLDLLPPPTAPPAA